MVNYDYYDEKVDYAYAIYDKYEEIYELYYLYTRMWWDFDDISIHDYEETPSYKCHGTCGSYRGKTDSFYPSDPDTIRQSKPRQVLKNAAKELKDFNQGKTHYNPNTHAWENDDDFGPFSID